MKLLPPPGSAERKRLTWLGAVLVALVGVFWLQQPATTPATSAAPAPATAGRPADAQTGPLPMPDAVQLNSLEDVPVLSDVGRNPFGFGVRPPPPAPPTPAVSLPIRPTGPPTPPAPQGPPVIGLKLTGMTVPIEGGRTMVTLMDPATNTTYLAYEGDIVDGRYRVVKVGVQSVVLSYVDGTGLRTLPLGG